MKHVGKENKKKKKMRLCDNVIPSMFVVLDVASIKTVHKITLHSAQFNTGVCS